MQLNSRPYGKRSQGFTLLEVLVAMVVLSVGLLGLSGLQTTSLRNNHGAFLRSQATLVSNDIIDRMRANRDSALAGDYDIVYADPPTPGCAGGTCSSAADVASSDLDEWRAYVERLPGGESQIDVDAADVATVSVCWGDVRGTSVPCDDPATDKLILVTRVQL